MMMMIKNQNINIIIKCSKIINKIIIKIKKKTKVKIKKNKN